MAGDTYTITCKGYLDAVHVQPPRVTEKITDVVKHLEAGDIPVACFLLGGLSAEAATMPLAYDVECGYEGEVDATYSGGRTSYTVYFTCPRCGTEGWEAREAGDDDPRL